MTALNEIRALMQPTLTTEIEQLTHVPKKSSEPPSTWKVMRFVQATRDLPNYFVHKREEKTINASFNSLHKKIETLTKKIETLDLPSDIAQMGDYRQFAKKDLAPDKPGVQELRDGIALLKQRSDDSAKITQLTTELEKLEKTIQSTQAKTEAHFKKVVQQQYFYKQGQNLRDLVQQFEKGATPDLLAKLSPESKDILNKAKDVMAISRLSPDQFKALLETTAKIVQGEPRIFREVQALLINLKQLDQPETLIPELLKAKEPQVTKEQVMGVISSLLPKIADASLKVTEKPGWLPSFQSSTPQPLISQHLNKQEIDMLKAMVATDITKLPPETAVLYTKTVLEAVQKGFVGAEPPDIAGMRNILTTAIATYDEKFRTKKLDVEQRKHLDEKITDNAALLIDRAFAFKTAAGRNVISKLMPEERKALEGLKAKLANLAKDPKQLKVAIENAMDLIDKAFSSQVQPIGYLPLPPEFKAEMERIRKNLKLLG